MSQRGLSGVEADNLRRSVRTLLLIALIASALALIGAIVLSNWRDGLRWTLYALATCAVGIILGLIFGVPRARTDFTADASERYSSNSNLEQISDWLTKLLVGAGLVELGNVPTFTKSLGAYLGNEMATPNAGAFSISAVVYGAGVGFAVGYLWTRLRLRMLLELSDRSAAEAARAEEITEVLRRSTAFAGESEQALRQAADSTLSLSKDVAQTRRSLLWVDDYPENNTALVELLRSLNVHVRLATSTAQAMSLLQSGNYRLVISDLGRVEGGENNPNAGLDLIHQMKQAGFKIPVIIYAGPRSLEMQGELLSEGAYMVTTRPTVLLPEVMKLLGGS